MTDNNLTAVVLAGGQGRRLGFRQKALQLYQHQPLLSHILARLQSQVTDIWVSCNAQMDDYRKLHSQLFKDIDPDNSLGPLAGMQAAWRVIDKDWLLFVPCDNPHLSKQLIGRLIAEQNKSHKGLIVAFDGQRIQPLYLLMHRSLQPALDEAISKQHLSVKRWIAEQDYQQADCSDFPVEAFANFNQLQQFAEQ